MPLTVHFPSMTYRTADGDVEPYPAFDAVISITGRLEFPDEDIQEEIESFIIAEEMGFEPDETPPVYVKEVFENAALKHPKFKLRLVDLSNFINDESFYTEPILNALLEQGYEAWGDDGFEVTERHIRKILGDALRDQALEEKVHTALLELVRRYIPAEAMTVHEEVVSSSWTNRGREVCVNRTLTIDDYAIFDWHRCLLDTREEGEPDRYRYALGYGLEPGDGLRGYGVRDYSLSFVDELLGALGLERGDPGLDASYFGE